MDNIITELDEVLKGLKSALFDNKSKESDNTLEIVNNIKHNSFNVSYKTESEQESGFITDEIKNVRPNFKNDEEKWNKQLVLLLIGLLIPICLLFVDNCCERACKNDQPNNQDKKEVHTDSVSKVSNLKNDIIIIYGNIDDVDNCNQISYICTDNIEYSAISSKSKSKGSCYSGIVLGICVVVVTMVVLYIIVIFIGFLREKQKSDSVAQNSIVEFNRRMYAELVHLKTAEAVFNKQLAEQELEMNKRAELIRFDEIQKYYDHKRKCELKEYELKDKYLNKVVEMVNKNLEIQKEEKVYKELKINAPGDVTLDSINFNKI